MRRWAAQFFWCVLAAVAACAPGFATAAERPVRVEAELEQSETWIGESVIYVVGVFNAPDDAVPDVKALEKDFTVEKGQDETSVSIINGRRTSLHKFIFSLTPKRGGRLEVPAAKVTVDGKDYQSEPLTLNVKPPEKQETVIVEIDAQPKRVYPTQPFKVTARVLMKPVTSNQREKEPIRMLRPSVLRIPWLPQAPAGAECKTDVSKYLSPMLTQDRGFNIPSLTVRGSNPFDLFERNHQAILLPKARREKRMAANGKEYEYWVYEFTLEYVSEKPAKMSFGPVTLRGPFITGLDGAAPVTREMYVVAPEVQVEAVDLLSKNAPADFTGAIGAVELRAEAQPKALRVGDPLTLELVVTPASGGGSLNLIGPPDLLKNEALAKDFTVIDERPVGEIVDGVKRFKYALRPKRAGVSLPPILIAYFDTKKETFERASSEPIELQVTDAARVNTVEVHGGPRVAPGKNDLREAEGGIYRNITDSDVLADRRYDVRVYAALPLLLFVAYLGLHLVVTRQRRYAADPARQRRSRALREARRRLESAPGSGVEAAAQIRAALLGLAADLRNLPEAGLTPRDAAEALAAGGASEEARKELLAALETLELSAYGGGSGGNLAGLRKRADELAARLDREVIA